MLATYRRHQPQAITHAITGVAVPNTPYRLLTRCFVSGGRRTSALVRTVKGGAYRLRRGYASSTNGSAHGPGGGPNPKDPHSSTSAPANATLFRRLLNAWKSTPTKWYPIPVAVGALLLVVLQYRKKLTRTSKEVNVDTAGHEVIRLKGPWQVHVLGALPLRNLSRLWGYLNSLELPIWFRPWGIRLYAFAFNCNLEEIEHADDLRKYVSLGDFFYRKLKDGVRPVDDAVLVSPADGTVLHFGTIQDLRVEQVKGITYSLDALLGVESGSSTPGSTPSVEIHHDWSIVDDHEFANVNGIEYSLDQLIGASTSEPSTGSATPTSSTAPTATSAKTFEGEDADAVPTKFGTQIDASVPPESSLQQTLAHDTSVALEMGVRPSLGERTRTTSGKSVKEGNALHFAVIYLAPGDYHRFHSPCAWVVEKRRHFVGELFSVSPYMAKRLENLFVLNERIALLGRWRHGFFGMVPVGATNVGSIKINFDQALRTNVRGRPPPPGTYSEAVYSSASPILNGQPLTPAQEMGGFCLGSTIVLVFEAPNEFEFTVNAGQKVKVGQRLGDVKSKLKKD